MDVTEQFGRRVFSDSPARDATRQRGSLLMTAQLRADAAAEQVKVRVRNLSAGGLMAELPHPLLPDSAVEVEVGGIGWIAGRVAWQTEGRVGIAFDHEVDPQLARKPAATGARRGATT